MGAVWRGIDCLLLWKTVTSDDICVRHSAGAQVPVQTGSCWLIRGHHAWEPSHLRIYQNLRSCRRAGRFSAGSGVWVCNAIKWLLHLVWSASFHLLLLIWQINQIREIASCVFTSKVKDDSVSVVFPLRVAAIRSFPSLSHNKLLYGDALGSQTWYGDSLKNCLPFDPHDVCTSAAFQFYVSWIRKSPGSLA